MQITGLRTLLLVLLAISADCRDRDLYLLSRIAVAGKAWAQRISVLVLSVEDTKIRHCKPYTSDDRQMGCPVLHAGFCRFLSQQNSMWVEHVTRTSQSIQMTMVGMPLWEVGAFHAFQTFLKGGGRAGPGVDENKLKI